MGGKKSAAEADRKHVLPGWLDFMNVVKEIERINEKELDLALSGASWHDEYKDSAYIFVGGLHFELTEGDVITIFSQYGEVMDVNLPRDKDTGKTKGFGFIMYEDQRSTVLAVDNLNGAKVLEKTLRVDHVKNYKQKKVKNEDGEWIDPEEQSFNAQPQMIQEDGESDSSASSGPEIDPEDPMYEYLIAQRKEAKALKKVKKSKAKGKHKDETPEERKARKERKRAKKQKKLEARGGRGRDDRRTDQEKSLEELLAELEGDVPMRSAGRVRSRTPEQRRSPPLRGERKTRSRSRTPPLRSDRPRSQSRSRTPVYRDDRRRSRSPRRAEDRRAQPDDRERDYDGRRR